MDAKAQVKLRFEAEDDFGLSEVALAFKLPGAAKPGRVLLQRSLDLSRRASGDYSWEMAPLGLMAGDRIAYYVEAVDNDEISGKKTGVSRTQYLKVYSEAEHHRQVLAQIDEQWESLVKLLADRLEGPTGARAANRRGHPGAGGDGHGRAGTGPRSGRAVAHAAPRQGPGAALAGAGERRSRAAREIVVTANHRSMLAVWLKRGIARTDERVRRLAAALEAEIGEEEKDVLYLETLLDEQRIDDILTLSKELAAKRET